MGSSSSEQIIGYKYYAGIHMVICHGPVDAITYIEAGEKKVWEGSITSSQSLSINKPELFGGEKKEGGITGTLDILFGDSTQSQNAYLQKKLGANIPAYRGVCSLVLKKMYLTAMTQYIKAWAVRVRRIPSKTWQPSYGNINGAANPAHIIREVITHKSWGMGLAEARIDEASFAAAASKLYSEGFGLSLTLTGQTPCEDFIKEILKHISGVLYNDRTTGNFKLKLIRDDYTIGSLPSFDESNIIAFNSFERPQFAEMVNEVIIVYRPQGQSDKQSVSIQDLSSIQAQEGGVISQTITYIGIDKQELAARVAQRDLRQYSTPLAQIRITVNRDGWQIEPGAAFKLSWESHGIQDMVCRATSINLGDYKGHQIIIDAVEDIFSLPTTSYLAGQTPQWVDPVSDPVAAPSQAIKELPYWNIKRQFSPAALDSVDALSSYIQLLVENPPVASPGYLLRTKPATASTYVDQFESEYTPKAKLLAAIGYTTLSITLKDVSGDIENVSIGTYAYLEDEIVRVDSINLSTLVLTIGRGCLDSVPKSHPIDSVIWFAEELCGIDYTEYLSGDNLNAKALVRTGSGLLPEASAPTAAIAMTARQNKPYPPGKIRINTLAYPDQISGALSITWAHRDRTLQLAKPLISEESGNIGPETGATYSLKLYDEKNVLRVNQSGLSSTSYSWTTEETDSLLSGRLNEYVRLQLWTVRSGLSSVQMCDFSIYRPQPPFNVIKPYITGMASVGETLSVSDGVWDFAPTSFTYQWTRNYAAISGATSSTYLVDAADDGSYLRCRVTAINSIGSVVEESINSVQIGTTSPYWTPLDITSAVLACWYRSSDSDTIVLSDTSYISQWSDKSPYGRDLLQTVAANRPQYLEGAVVADGSNDTLTSNTFADIPDGTQNAYTMVAVTTPQEDQTSIAGQSNTGTTFYSLRSVLNVAFSVIGNTTTTSGPVVPVLSISGNAISFTETRNALAPFLVSRSVSIGIGNKSSVVIKRTAAGAISSSINFETGVAGATATVLDISWTGFQTPSVYEDSGYFNGKVHEALVLLGTLSDAESKKLEGYLAWNNGLVDKLPSNHLYKLEPPLKKTYYYDLVMSAAPSYYWKVNETSGTTLVPITGGISASLAGAYTLGVAGLVYADPDRAIEFTSTTGYGITALDSGLALGTGDFTACAIIKFTTTVFSTVFGVRAGTDNSNILFLLATSRITAGDISAETWAWQDTNTRVRKSGMNDGKAHSVTVRYIHSTMMLELWIDGALADSRVQAVGRPTSSQKVVMGNNTNFVQGFTGVFDEPILFNRALSDAEIISLHTMSMGA